MGDMPKLHLCRTGLFIANYSGEALREGLEQVRNLKVKGVYKARDSRKGQGN